MLVDEDISCDEINVPERLHTGDRPVDPDFPPDEKVYRWYRPDTQIQENGQVAAGAVGRTFQYIHDTSVNRGKCCDYPTDVLYSPVRPENRFDHGVLEGEAGEIEDARVEIRLKRTGEEGGELRIFTFKLHHEPMKCMYPHSVIALYENDERVTQKPKPKHLRLLVRKEVARRLRVCHEPDPDFTPPE